MDKIDICMIVLVICGIGFGFCVSQIMGTVDFKELIQEESIQEKSIPISEQEIIDNCKNLSLKDSAICLRDEIESFFIYNVTDDEIAKNMTLEEIKKFGVDCTGWAYLYSRLANGLDFESNTNNFKGLKDVYPGHRWATMWDDEMWCRINQLKVKCAEIDNE